MQTGLGPGVLGLKGFHGVSALQGFKGLGFKGLGFRGLGV